MWQKLLAKVFQMKTLPFSFSLPQGRLKKGSFCPKFSPFPTLIVCSTPQNTVSCNAAGNAVLTAIAAFYVHGTWGLEIQILG